MTTPGSAKTFKAKWGDDIADAGFTAVPNILIEKLHALGLRSIDTTVLLVLLKYWWVSDQFPYPSKQTIAEQLGVQPRTVQRSIANLRELALIETTKRPGPQGTNEYSFGGLIKFLSPHAKKANAQRAEHKRQKRQQQRRKRVRPEEADDA